MPTFLDVKTPTISGPDAPWLVRHARAHGADAFRFLRDLVAEFGDTVRYRTPFGPATFFNHPEGVRQVLHRASVERSALVTLSLGQGLLASDGAYWRGQRNLAQPALHPRCIEGFAPLIARRRRKDGELATRNRTDADNGHGARDAFGDLRHHHARDV